MRIAEKISAKFKDDRKLVHRGRHIMESCEKHAIRTEMKWPKNFPHSIIYQFKDRSAIQLVGKSWTILDTYQPEGLPYGLAYKGKDSISHKYLIDIQKGGLLPKQWNAVSSFTRIRYKDEKPDKTIYLFEDGSGIIQIGNEVKTLEDHLF